MLLTLILHSSLLFSVGAKIFFHPPAPGTMLQLMPIWENGVVYFYDNTDDVYYHGEPPEACIMLFSKLGPQSIASVMDPIRVCGWWYVPWTYVFVARPCGALHGAEIHDRQRPESGMEELIDILIKCAQGTWDGKLTGR